MMCSYEYNFAMALLRKLKSRIVGRIYVDVTSDDELFVKIENNDFTVSYSFGNFSTRFLNGWTTETAVYEVIQQYTDTIYKRTKRKYFW